MREKMQRKTINKGKYIGFWLNNKTNDKMIQVCETRNITFSAFIRECIKKGISDGIDK